MMSTPKQKVACQICIVPLIPLMPCSCLPTRGREARSEFCKNNSRNLHFLFQITAPKHFNAWQRAKAELIVVREIRRWLKSRVCGFAQATLTPLSCRDAFIPLASHVRHLSQPRVPSALPPTLLPSSPILSSGRGRMVWISVSAALYAPALPQGTDARRRGLMDMMGGVLEVKKEDILKMVSFLVILRGAVGCRGLVYHVRPPGALVLEILLQQILEKLLIPYKHSPIGKQEELCLLFSSTVKKPIRLYPKGQDTASSTIVQQSLCLTPDTGVPAELVQV